MIDILNKTVGFVANPLFVGMIIVMIALVLVWRNKVKAASWTLGAALVWFWFWAMPIVSAFLGLYLEKDYPVQLAEDMPKADAIALMGGGIWGATNYPYANLSEGADRAWHAARLWKAEKAPVIIPSNVGAELADVKLLVDLGIPREAVVLENKAVNTEENAKFIRRLFDEGTVTKIGNHPKVLIVTSACHMRRSLFMFRKYAPDFECIPAATDYQVLPWTGHTFKCRQFLPNIGSFAHSNSFIHEYIGYYGYKWFR